MGRLHTGRLGGGIKMSPRKDPQERLLSLCIPEPNSGCWLWLGAIATSGYGRIGVGYKNEGTRGTDQAHRVAYKMFIGPIPNGADVCHQCDNRICINPDHLFVGTRQDNVDDMMRKERYWNKRKPSKREWNVRRRLWAIR